MSDTFPALERKKSVCARTGFCARTIEKKVSLGLFPRPITIGKNSFWDRRQVDAWIEERLIEGRAANTDTARFAELGRRSAAARRAKRIEARA
jgi:predicted DNA-binding transcriptional regulator AlpA